MLINICCSSEERADEESPWWDRLHRCAERLFVVRTSEKKRHLRSEHESEQRQKQPVGCSYAAFWMGFASEGENKGAQIKQRHQWTKTSSSSICKVLDLNICLSFSFSLYIHRNESSDWFPKGNSLVWQLINHLKKSLKAAGPETHPAPWSGSLRCCLGFIYMYCLYEQIHYFMYVFVVPC